MRIHAHQSVERQPRTRPRRGYRRERYVSALGWPLRSLEQASRPDFCRMNGHPRQETRELSSIEDDKRGDSKRKGEEASLSQIRAKRNRYISLAWYGGMIAPASSFNPNADSCRVATSVSAGRSNAMARHHVTVVGTSTSNAFMHQTAAAVCSRRPSSFLA
jgi:IS5 family transposase